MKFKNVNKLAERLRKGEKWKIAGAIGCYFFDTKEFNQYRYGYNNNKSVSVPADPLELCCDGVTEWEQVHPDLKIDAKVLVWEDDSKKKIKRYFSHFDRDNKIWVFCNGSTSWSSSRPIITWKNYEEIK